MEIRLYKIIKKTFTFVRHKFEYNSLVWNYLSLTKSNSIEVVQRKFKTMLYDNFV